MAEFTALYLAVINLATFAAFAFDKRAAERRTGRTPERRLLMLAAAGGSLGALLAQQTLRHKTRKEPFRTWLWAIVVAQMGIVIFVAYRLLR